jgi:hypothetical protein
MFVIEDHIHCDWIGEYPDRAAAVAALRHLAETPWDEPPNRAPCMSWRTCGREYALVEYDTTTTPWSVLQTIPALDISPEETCWLL